MIGNVIAFPHPHRTARPYPSPLPEARLRLGAEHLHDLARRCGPRPIAEFMLEIGERCGCLPEILDALDDWRRVDPEMVAAVLAAWCRNRAFAPAVTEVPRDA